MERRRFLAASIATSAVALAGNAAAQAPSTQSREFFAATTRKADRKRS
jgi:hypothetical protein